MYRPVVIIWTGALAGALLVAMPSRLSAQRGGAHFAAPSGPALHFGAGAHFPSNFGTNFRSNFSSNFLSRYGSLAAFPFLADPLYTDALYDAGYPVASQPPVIFVQGAPAAATPEVASLPKEPLLIELRGDRYVRVGGESGTGAEAVDGETVLPRPQTNAVAASHAVQELLPVILVFRDGHHEEVSSYTIADGVLYASGDFYSSGSWNRKIELAALNLSETVASNRSRGVQFRLPSAPNEVIVRP
jgi:hypothetical protein